MKKWLVIFFLSFGLGLWVMSLMTYAKQTNMPSYYPSPSGNYTKVHLMNQGGSSITCNGANAGTIFADPTTGYLEICKSDGTVASYPGSCFNRFGTSVASPPCPNNYQQSGGSQRFAMTPGNNVVSWSCCFTGQGAQNVPVAKSGCFSTYSNTYNATHPPPCNAVDANAYDLGCDTICSSEITTTYKRNCCFNYSSVNALGVSSSCTLNACYYCGAVPAHATACSPTAPPTAINQPYTISGNGSGSCAGAACSAYCNSGYVKSGNSCVVPCTPSTCNANGYDNCGNRCDPECFGQTDGTPCNRINCNQCENDVCSGSAMSRKYYGYYGGKCQGGQCGGTTPFCDFGGTSCANGANYCSNIFNKCPNETCGGTGFAACSTNYSCGTDCTCHQACQFDGDPCSTAPIGEICCSGLTCVTNGGSTGTCHSPCSGSTPCGSPGNCTAIPDGKCDCAGHVNGCDDVCNSGKVNDSCGVCNGPGPQCHGYCSAASCITACKANCTVELCGEPDSDGTWTTACNAACVSDDSDTC